MEVLEIHDELSDEEERALRHVAKAKQHGKAKQAAESGWVYSTLRDSGSFVQKAGVERLWNQDGD